MFLLLGDGAYFFTGLTDKGGIIFSSKFILSQNFAQIIEIVGYNKFTKICSQ